MIARHLTRFPTNLVQKMTEGIEYDAGWEPALGAVLASAQAKDKNALATALVRLREVLRMSPEQLAEQVGAHGRTIRRWEKGQGRGPTPNFVRKWQTLLAQSRSPATQHSIESTRDGRRLGIFTTTQLLDRIKRSTTVWAFRCRVEFRGNFSPVATAVILDRIADGSADFRLYCAWIQPAVLIDERHLAFVKPANTPKRSFKTICGNLLREAEKQGIPAAQINARVRGLELSLEVAARHGLCNGAGAHLVLAYPDSTEFGAPVELFDERPAAWYRNSRVPETDVEEYVWLQEHPPIAVELVEDVWRLQELEAKAKAVFTPQSILQWNDKDREYTG